MQSTAAELWREWERSGVIRPQDYDSDVVEHLRRVLSGGGQDGSGPVERAMDNAGWRVRDLLHALAPLITSFTGMQRDLLRLLQRVGASSGTGENLRLQYEFVEGDVIDDSLADFRERIRLLETVIGRLQPLAFNASDAFDTGLRTHLTHEVMETINRSVSAGNWRFADGVPDPPPTGVQRVDDLAHRVISLVRRVLARLECVAADTVSARDWADAHRDDLEHDPVLEQIILASNDLWPLSTAAAVSQWTAGVAAGTIVVSDDFLAEVETWLDGFEVGEPEEASIEQAVEELLDVLSLPAWGKRHELYSAWIVTQLDRALDSRLEFVVTDGALRFPFHATLLAHLPTRDGPVELWCEVRSPATGQLHGGRKRNIQPDYRFQFPADGVPTDGTTVAALEVKQYKSPAATKHGGTLRDYVRNLPDATVMLVAHGPLGAGVMEAVPQSDRSRARIHEDVRVGRPHESAEFRAEVAQLFPPPGARPTRIELHWSPAIADLDLHVRGTDQETFYKSSTTAHSTLRGDAFNGGPEIVDLDPDTEEPIDVLVHVYSTGRFRDAAPVVTLYCDEDPVLVLSPTDDLADPDERWWNVARIDGTGNVTPSEESMTSAP